MSVEVTLDIAGVEECTRAFSRFDAEMKNRVHEQLTRWAEAVRTEARRLVPVRTGYLRSTIFARIQEWTAEVGTEAVYAADVEFGTRYAVAQPFVQPAVQAHLPELERALSTAVDFAKAEVGL
jgi:HK97 gp10 family phage protein